MTDDLDLGSLLAEVRAKKAIAESEPQTGYQQQLHQWKMRRHWLATMWLLGASHAQLAALTRTTRASMAQAIGRELKAEDRHKIKLSCTHTELSWNLEKYYNNLATLKDLTPKAAAEWLVASHPYTED